MRLSTPQRVGGKVKPSRHRVERQSASIFVLFLDLSGKIDFSLEKPHILAELQHGGKNWERPCSVEGSRGLADALKAIFSCGSFVSALHPNDAKDWALANCVFSRLKVCFLSR